jgi:hypothetical protein
VWTDTAVGEIELVNQPYLNYLGKTLEEAKDWPTASRSGRHGYSPGPSVSPHFCVNKDPIFQPHTASEEADFRPAQWDG